MFGHTPAAGPPRDEESEPRATRRRACGGGASGRRRRRARPGRRAAPVPGARQYTGSSMAAPLQCPTCEVEVPTDSPAYPFCSQRCRLLDLDRWITGKFVVSRPLDARDVEELEATLEGAEPSARHAAADDEDAEDEA